MMRPTTEPNRSASLLCCLTHLAAGYLWSSDSWNDATWRKVPAAQELLLLGYNIIMSDIDVMWLKDPLPYFNTQAAQVKPADVPKHRLLITAAL